MRSSVWCLALALVACGKSERSGDADRPAGGGGVSAAGSGGGTIASSGSGGSGPSGGDSGGAAGSGASGTGGSSSSGTSSTGGSSIGGAGGSDAGGRQASGGLGASAGNAGGGAGSGASAGDGGSIAGGEAGDAGAAGAASLECAGEYRACGCHCCDGTTPSPVCYYPDGGDSLASIERADQNAAQDPSCATACSSGLRYVCCALPSDPAPAASYAATGGFVRDDLYSVSLYRTGADDRCQFVQIARGAGPDEKKFPIVLPEGWVLAVAWDSTCADKNSEDPSKFRNAIGGLGSLRFATENGECTTKFDFTLFFESSSGGIDALRFASDGTAGAVVPECD